MLCGAIICCFQKDNMFLIVRKRLRKMKIKDILYRQKDNIKVAIEYLTEKVTYSQLHEKVAKNKELLLKQSKSLHCNNIGLFLPNSIDYVVGYFTIAYLNRVIIPIEISLSQSQFLSTINYCEIGMIITSQSFLQTIQEYCKTYPFDLEIYLVDLNEVVFVNGKVTRKVLKEDERIAIERGVAIMLHTSGTTSNPKKVMLSHRNLIANIESNIDSLGLNENDKTLIVLPMFFGYCNSSQFLSHLYLGAGIVIAEQPFTPVNFLKLIEEKKCTNTTCVPSMLFLISKIKRKYDISSLRYLCFGGGVMPVEQLHKIIDYFEGAGVVQTYGQTEASPRITCLLPADSLRKIGSVGKAIPNVIVDIFDESDRPVKIGESGEIVVKGANVMVGYYKHLEETKKVIRNGWLHTGDIGKFDDEGYLYIVGRLKNMIISGGLNIYPEEIEEVLINHKDIKEALVVGEEHSILGEVPVAKVVTDNEELQSYDIIEYCTKLLDAHKIPRKIIFCSELEKTYTGKLIRNQKE